MRRLERDWSRGSGGGDADGGEGCEVCVCDMGLADLGAGFTVESGRIYIRSNLQ